MTEKKSDAGWDTGQGDSLMMMEVCSQNGVPGRDADQSGKGRIFMFPYTFPKSIPQEKGIFGHIMTSQPQGPFGATVHQDMLDGLRCGCKMNNEGVPFIYTFWASETNTEELPQGYTEQGDETYVGDQVEEGK